MSLLSGERQVAPSREGIRRDHLARYEWAAAWLPNRARVVDLACGVGYGTQLLAQKGHHAYGFDKDREALAYARQNYAHPRAFYRVADAERPWLLGKFEAAVCFETIEHIKDPAPMLRALCTAAPLLLASVPNESVFPWKNYAFHHRHYTKAEFQELLERAGWRVIEWWGQEGPESEVVVGCDGRTLLAVAERAEQDSDSTESIETTSAARQAHQRAAIISGARADATRVAKPAAPKHVSIVGLGPSSAQYVAICKGLGGRRKFCDETWGINAFGDVLKCDRIFHMDDVRVQEIRAAAAPESNIAGMLEWLKTHPGPIVTSRAHPDYPGLVDFPLEEVVNECPNGYFNSTAAYAVAYAIWLGVEKVSLFGCDFTYPDAHDAEKGRACVEFWLGIAAQRGIKIVVPKTTSLLDALHSQAERFYGYDMVDLDIKRQGERIVIGFTNRVTAPTADEIEARYDHAQHPNPLVEGDA